METEKRLIDANELTDHLNHTTMVAYPNLFPGLLAAVEIVDDSPTVDAVEVVHGRWKTGCIISGYQGIGKSTLAKEGSGYIDLESGNFFVDGVRAENWYVAYCQIAIHLAEQGYRVFISSHAVVREYLTSLPKTVGLYVCFPSYSLREAWVTKLEDRYRSSGLNKDYRAWQNAVCRYDENIKELHNTNGFIPIVIHDMNYSLVKLLDKALDELMREDKSNEG